MTDPTDPNVSPVAAWDTASKSLQTFAVDMQKVSKEAVEASSQIMEKLRSAKTMEEVISLQTGFMQQSFKHYAEFARRFGELMVAMPMDFAKQSRAAFQQGADTMTKGSQHATEGFDKPHD